MGTMSYNTETMDEITTLLMTAYDQEKGMCWIIFWVK
jgi:hypothetical protein